MLSEYNLIWAIINFVVLFAILKMLLWKPIVNLLEERRDRIRGNLLEAEEARSEAKELREEYEEHLEQAQRETREIINKATDRAEDIREEMMESAREETEKMLQDAEEIIERRKREAVLDLQEEMAELVIVAAGKVLRRELTDEDQKRLAGEFVREVGEIQ